MKIANVIKFTSLAALGTWMLMAPSSSAFAANQKVEDEVHATVNSIMQKTPDSTGAKKLKNEELAKLRLRKAEEIQTLKGQYGDGIEQIQALLEKIKGYSQEAGQYKETLGDKFGTAASITGGAAAGVAIAIGVSKALALMPIPGSRVAALILGGGALLFKGISEWLNDPEAARATTEDILGAGSYASTLKQYRKNMVEINFNPEQLREGQKKDADVAKAEALIANYNAAIKEFQQLIDKLMPGVIQLDQLIDEYSALPTTIGAGQELYTYQIWGKDKQGNPKLISEYYFVMDKDGSLKSIEGVTQGCIPLPAKLAEAQSCIYCPLFKTIFNAAQSMSTKSYDKLASPIANLILIGFALVIAFMVLKNVSSFTKQDAPKFVTELLVNMFKVLIAYYMLKNSSIVYGYIIGPVLKAGFEFGSSLLFATDNNYLSSCAAQLKTNDAIIGVMPTYLYTNLDCFIRAVQAEVAVPQSIGSSLMCVARNAGKVSIGPLRNVMWDFGMMFQGFAIWVMGWIISLAFAFYLIDATIQLGIIGALMPFLIACWPFKATKSYTSKGWEMFMNTFFVYVFMGLVVSINVELLGQGLTGSAGGFDAVKAALNGNNVSKLKELLDIGFAGFLVLVACCLFAFKLTGQASSLAGTMAGGGGPSIGANIGGLAYGAATKGVQGTTKFGLKTTKAVSDKIGLTSAVNKGKDWAKDKILGAVGLGRKSGAAGNKAAQNSYRNSQNGGGATPGDNAGTQTPSNNTPNPTSNNPVAQNQIKKMAQAGSRAQTPATPNPGAPNSKNAQQLAEDYKNSDAGRFNQQQLQNLNAKHQENLNAEKAAQSKMDYHNKNSDNLLKQAEAASDPAAKQKFEKLANEQFDQAVKAEAELKAAQEKSQKSAQDLEDGKQRDQRDKNNFILNNMDAGEKANLENNFNNSSGGQRYRQKTNQASDALRQASSKVAEAESNQNNFRKQAEDYKKQAENASNSEEKQKFERLANENLDRATKAEAELKEARNLADKLRREYNSSLANEMNAKNDFILRNMK